MSEIKWQVTMPERVQILGRGAHNDNSFLQLTLDSIGEPVPQTGANAVREAMRAAIAEDLRQSPVFSTYARLRDNLNAVERQLKDAELTAQAADLERQRAMLRPYSIEQVQQVNQAAQEHRQATGAAASFGGVREELKKQLAGEEKAAEQRLKRGIEKAHMAALVRRQEEADVAAKALAEAAGPALNAFCAALQKVKHTCGTIDMLWWDYRHLLNEVQPAVEPPAVEATPPPAPPAPLPTTTHIPEGALDLGAPLAVVGDGTQSHTLIADLPGAADQAEDAPGTPAPAAAETPAEAAAATTPAKPARRRL